MATERGSSKNTPLSVIEPSGAANGKTGQDVDMNGDERETTIAELRETLKSVRAQVEQLSRSVADLGGRAGKSVVDGVVAGKDSAVSTVETHPFYAILAASAAAFILGRLSVAPERSVAERAYGRLHDFASWLEPRLSDTVRSKLH